MKLFAVIRKDLTQSSRSLFALAFMFLVPMLTTVLFYFIFGGVSDEEDQFSLPRTQVVIVNLDQGEVFSTESALPADTLVADPSIDLSGIVSMGDLLTRILLSDSFSEILTASESSDSTTARTAVDQQEAGVAIIIPTDFSAALTEQAKTANVELYQDPTLTLGPAIVESIVNSLLDGFMASKITIGVTIEQLIEAGVPLTPELIQEIVNQTTATASQAMSVDGSSEQPNLIEVVEISSGVETSLMAGILGTILSGMSIFYLFFTGAASMQSILVEEEKGTLPRLFTTPTPRTTILYGKAIAVFVILIVQISVLLIFGKFVFNIYWGEPLQIAVVAIVCVILAGATGIFIVSWLQNTRQAGVVFGGVLTITGMIGMASVFTSGTQNVSPAVQTASLVVPQGWAVRAFQITMEGGALVDLLPILGGILVWAIAFSLIGIYRLRKRYA